MKIPKDFTPEKNLEKNIEQLVEEPKTMKKELKEKELYFSFKELGTRFPFYGGGNWWCNGTLLDDMNKEGFLENATVERVVHLDSMIHNYESRLEQEDIPESIVKDQKIFSSGKEVKRRYYMEISLGSLLYATTTICSFLPSLAANLLRKGKGKEYKFLN